MFAGQLSFLIWWLRWQVVLLTHPNLASVLAAAKPYMLAQTWMELCLDSLCIELSFSIYRQIGQSAGLHAATLPGNPGHLSDTSYSDAGSTTIMGDGSSRLTQGSELLVTGEGTQGL